MKDPKDDLLNLIKESRNKSRFVVKRASEIGEYSQYVNDLADASERAISCVSYTNIDWQPQIRSWRYLNQHLDGISRDIGQISIDVASSSASTATSCMLDFVNPDHFAQFASPDREMEARTAAINLGNVIDRLAEKSKALELLHEFGLSTTAPGRKSPPELLEAACAAFERPVTQGSAASTSLIPMRECINSTVAALLQRRPKQEPAKSHRDKILSIGSQTAHSGITDWAIELMADRWEKLSKELSSSKQKDVPREEWMAIMRRAMVLLIEFLQSLDQTKMK
jgi:hypothetical protein